MPMQNWYFTQRLFGVIHAHSAAFSLGPSRRMARYDQRRRFAITQGISMDTVRRAFELAAVGNCRSLEELRARLRRERLESVDAHLSGTTIRTQLKALMQRRK